REELEKIGFKSLGANVLLSDKSSIYSPEKISIGNNVRIDDFCILSGDIIIGNYVHIAAYAALYGGAGIEIQDFVGISARGIIYSQSDDYSGEAMSNPMIPEKYKKITSKKVKIGKHVLVGAASVVLPGVDIKEGSAVGSMSLVTRSTENWKLYSGIPAKILKDRKKDLLELEKKFLEEQNKITKKECIF
ncbi:MAG: acyltransferase, partial [Fusobacteriaceae bacterium]